MLDLLASVYEQLKTISRGCTAYTKGGEAASVDDEDEAEDEDNNEQNDEEAAFAGDSLPDCARSFEELSKAFKIALKKWEWGPLTIFLDSVDQVFHTHPSCF